MRAGPLLHIGAKRMAVEDDGTSSRAASAAACGGEAPGVEPTPWCWSRILLLEVFFFLRRSIVAAKNSPARTEVLGFGLDRLDFASRMALDSARSGLVLSISPTVLGML